MGHYIVRRTTFLSESFPARWDNLLMRRLIGRAHLPVITVVAAFLGGCASKLPVPTGRVDRSKADESAIRRTLADAEQRINQGDLEFLKVFANDAVIIAPSVPDVIGFDAIRTAYSEGLKQASMEVHFSTEEVTVAGDLAYEHGTYTIRMADRKTGRVLLDAKNKHIHIMKRQADGAWKTWRMMVNSAEPISARK